MAGTSNLKPFKPGVSPNPGGRPKRLIPRVDQSLHELGIDPVKFLINLLPDLRPAEQAKVMLDLLSYLQPKPKEITEDEDNVIDALSTKEILKIVEEKYPEIKKDIG